MTTATKMIYLDHISGTPVDPRVVEAMLPYFNEKFGNPSAMYSQGSGAAAAVKKAREQVAALINAQPEEIIFTSCASEANNLAVKGLAQANSIKGKHLIVSAIEHFSVLHPAKSLAKLGFEVTEVPVDSQGIIKLDELKKAIRPETCLVSVTHASNEIGVVQDLRPIGVRTKENGIIFHSDSVQAAGVIPVDVKALGVDALTLSANQFYGPQGVSALYLKKGTRILPLIEGGIQEGGRRSGTENVAGIVGMGKAAELAKAEMDQRIIHYKKLQQKLIAGLKAKVPTMALTGSLEQRLPNHVSGCVQYIEGESMSMFLDMEGISISTGSACVSKILKASHVVKAIGIDAGLANGSVVISFGKDTSEADIDTFLAKFPPIVERLQAMSPLKGGK